MAAAVPNSSNSVSIPPQKSNQPSKKKGFFEKLFSPKPESPKPIQRAVKLQSTVLTQEDEKLLKQHLQFEPKNYSIPYYQGEALRKASRSIEGDLQVRLLKILFKLGIKPYALPDSGYSYAFEQLFMQPKFNKEALDAFLVVGLETKDIPLHYLKMENLLDIFKQALDKGANPNQLVSTISFLTSLFSGPQRLEQVPLLHWLSVRTDEESSEYLQYLLKRADINVRDKEGRTALMAALNNPAGCQEAITLLLKAGSDQTIRDANGRTGLFYLLMSAEDPTVFEKTLNTLVSHGLDLSTQFNICLELLVDFASKNKQVDIWSKAHIANNLVIMVEKGAGADTAKLLLLPPQLQQRLQAARDGSSESADTSSRGSPARLSESPKETFPTPDWLTMLLYNASPDLFQDPAIRTSVQKAFQTAALTAILSSNDEDLKSSLEESLSPYLTHQRLASSKQNAALFEAGLVKKLTDWKTKQRTVDTERREKVIEATEQKSFMEQATIKMETAAQKAEAAAKAAQVHAQSASSDASLAHRYQAGASLNAANAGTAANLAHIAAARPYYY